MLISQYFFNILRIEQGNRFVPDYEVAIIAEYFNISTDELLGTGKSKQ